MKKYLILLVIGLFAGAVDIVPLVLADAPVFNMLAVIVFWIVAVFFIFKVSVLSKPVMNGLVVSVLLMLPLALAVSATNPKDFIPMMLMAMILGPLNGFLIGRLVSKEHGVRE